MTARRKPSGFVARCQCGKVVGALDYELTGRADSGRLLGAWISDGCTIVPQFGGSWSAQVEVCSCDPQLVSAGSLQADAPA